MKSQLSHRSKNLVIHNNINRQRLIPHALEENDHLIAFVLSDEGRSRLNTVYMVSYFVGGSLGSLLGAYAWSIAHWTGVCTVGTLLLVVALAIYTLNTRRMRWLKATA